MDLRKSFLFGVLSGSLVTLYALFVRDNMRAYDTYNRAMTNLMNAAPPEQRMGFTEDFPEGTKWEL